MLVKHIMIPREKLTQVSINDTVEKTIELIDERSLLSLPVVDGDQFVGVISKKYIFEEFFNGNEDKDVFMRREVSEFMKSKLESVYATSLVEEAAQILLQHNRQFIPVIDEEGIFRGIVTHKAIFKTFTQILGIGHTRIAITTRDNKGKLAKLAELITKQGGNIISIAQIDIEVMNLREIVLRVDVENPKKLIETLNSQGFAVRHVHQ